MSRPKLIPSEKLISLFEEYRLTGSKYSTHSFGDYVRSHGYKDVEDYTIRRDKPFLKYRNDIKQNSEEQIYKDLVTYKALDVDAFLAKNNTLDKLKEAISTRDRYYARIAANAAEAINARKETEKKAKLLDRKNNELKMELAKVQAKADNKDIRQKKELISKLRALLSSYVYPDAANAILKKDGILEVLNSLIPDEVMDSKVIHADTEVSASKYGVVNDLLGGFDE